MNEGSYHPPFEQQVLAALKKQSGLFALTVIVNILVLYLFETVGVRLVLWLLDVTGFSLLSIEAINELYTLLLYVVAFFLPYLMYAKAMNFKLSYIPHDRPYPPILLSCTGAALGLSAIGMVLSMVVSTFFAMFGLFPPDVSMTVPSDPFGAVLYVVNLVAIPALVEEITYRGIILGTLRPYGDKFAIIISAVFFALLHRNMAQFPNALLLGLALGYFMVKTNSIWTTMILHATNNLLVLILSTVIENMDVVGALVTQGLWMLCYVVFGVFALIYFFGIRKLDMSLNRSACPVRQGALYRRFFVSFPVILLLVLFVWIIFINFSTY